MEENNNQIFKDYSLKIKNKLNLENNENNDIISDDINNLIIFLNWCFQKRNNFFILDFNKKNIFSVCTTYNQIKTNVLSKDSFNELNNIFDKIDYNNLKTLKFILHNYITNYNDIQISNTELCEKISKVSIKNCITYINMCFPAK
jgi:hypothetical protein